MNSEENLLAPAANETVSTTGQPLVEQPRLSNQVVPRGISIQNLIYQWQPMGIRVIVDLPFIGNDQDCLFMIRNGPLIPRWNKVYMDTWRESGFPVVANVSMELKQFAWNNMRNVYHGHAVDKQQFSSSGIHITYYDYPPVLSSLCQSFRRWRGDMQYRIRSIAGFATQGYIIVAPFKNLFSPIGSYNEYKSEPAILRQDASYREAMMNAYVMADTSMFRHVEVSVPYEYPAPWYDQYAWMARRVCGTRYAVNSQFGSGVSASTILNLEPHGDNFIGVLLRGQVATTSTGGQIVFELEYRAQEGFQFADPGLPPDDLCEPYIHWFLKHSAEKPEGNVKSVLDPKLTSDGYNKIETAPSLLKSVAAPLLATRNARPQASRVKHSVDQLPHEREIAHDDRETRSLGRREQEFS